MCEGRFVRMHGKNSDAVSRQTIEAAEYWRSDEAHTGRTQDETTGLPARRDRTTAAPLRRARSVPVRRPEPAQLPAPRGIPVEFPERIEVEIPQVEPARRSRWW